MLHQKILKGLKNILAQKEGPIPVHEPYFNGHEWDYVKECLDSGWVSSVGKFVDKFEYMLAEYTGVKKAVVVVNGTSALHIALKIVGVKPNDEVLVPSLTFIATANAITYCGAVPHFVDSEEKTLGLDPWKLKNYLEEIVDICDEGCLNKQTGRYIKAVIPMHTFGHPVDLEPLVEVCKQFKLEMVEDAAEALGTLYKDKHVGNWGKLSILSFNGNKIITTGGGGAIITNDEQLGNLAKHLTTTARLPHKWEFYHDQIGYNYRMPNINAALGCAQLEQLDVFLQKKRILAKQYSNLFKDIKGLIFFTEPNFARSNYWLNAIYLNKEEAINRDKILEITNSNGIMTRPVWQLIHKSLMFAKCPRMNLETAVELEKRLINIPSSVNLL